MFSGLSEVFKFTLHQICKGKGFKLATYGLSVLLFVIFFGINVGIAFFNQADDEKEAVSIEKLYIYNEADLPMGEELLQGTEFEKVLVENVGSSTITLKEDEALLHLTVSPSEYMMELTLSDPGTISEEEGEELLGRLEEGLRSYKYLNSGIEAEKLTIILSPINVMVTEIGAKDTSIGELLIKMILPMVLSFVLYFMLLYYGQSLGKTIMAERSSKLMELLLVSARPYAIVSGKILATALIALLQIFLWIFGGVLGFAIGDKVASAISPSYNNVIIEIVNLIRNNTASDAFSVSVIITAIIALCIGFLFYSVLAGLIFSNITKAEELSNGNGIFVMFIIIGFFSSYFLTAFNSGTTEILLNVLRYVPIVSPFILPADILVGNISLLGGMGSLCITVVCIFLLILLTGRQYKKKLFAS